MTEAGMVNPDFFSRIFGQLSTFDDKNFEKLAPP